MTRTAKIPDATHPITISPTGSRVTVRVGGVTVADTKRALSLAEANYPVAQYIPLEDVDQTLLDRTTTQTYCPYKGDASYWSLKLGDKTYKDFVWAYPRPIAEIPKIENLLCFYNEKVDLFVDGVKQERPVSPFS